MAQQSQGTSTHEPEGKKREARAQRILDAAATLILRYGYHKTTIEDIAREAGVGKGTLYLHWKTREALFAALILREKVAMAEDIKQRIACDVAGATLRGLLKHAVLALMQRPLLKAVLLRDTEVFGKLVEREQGSSTSVEVLAGFTAYFQGLREQGLVRTDLSLRAQAALFGSIFLGFFLAAPLLPGAFKPSDEELAELMAETGHRTLEPRDAIPTGALQSASHSLTQYLDRSVASAQEQLHGDVQADGEHDHPKAEMLHFAQHDNTSVQADGEEDLSNARLQVRARGRKGGRSKKLKTAAAVAEARRMYADRTRSIEEICAALGISRASFYRYMKDAQDMSLQRRT